MADGLQPPAVIGVVMLDCADAERSAEFWSGLLGVPVAHRSGQFVFLARPEKGSPMGFQQVPEPKVVKNRAHVDLIVADKEATQTWIEDHGGHKIEQHSTGDFTWFRMADPEGNEFCIHE